MFLLFYYCSHEQEKHYNVSCFCLQEDVINTQCGYDIRAKPVSNVHLPDSLFNSFHVFVPVLWHLPH